jgi:signal recognition particle subunit SRP54
VQADYTLDDFRRQLHMLRQQGQQVPPGLPMGDFPDAAGSMAAELDRMERIIEVMTVEERRDPDQVGMPRRWAIAQASGATLPQVCTFFGQFGQFRKLMRRLGQKP